MQDTITKRLRRIDIICASAILALIGCSIGAGVIPLYRARASNLAKVQQLQGDIANLSTLNLTIVKAQTEIAQAEARLAEEESHLPDSQAMDKFMTELAKVAEAAGLQLDAISPKPLIEGGTYKVMPVKITGVGSYETCYKFLTGLRNMTRLTRLDELQIQLQRDDKTDPRKPVCEITVSISTFVTR